MTRTGLGAGRLAALCGFAAVALAALGALGADRVTAATVPSPVRPSIPSEVDVRPIGGLYRVGPDTVLAEVLGGYCSGARYRPAIERVTLGWRRVGGARFRAVLTAQVRFPSYAPPPTGPAYCADLGLIMRAKVKIPRPVAQTRFFDGSASPPKRIRVFSRQFLTD